MKIDTTSKIMSMLADRYKGSEWAYVTEVPDCVGDQAHRRIDAIAIGVKSSTVGEFHGFEVKSSRSDWMRDLEYPEKSKSWRNLVTSFWLVAGRGVAKLEEIPPKWGFLEVSYTGSRLKIRKQPWEEDRKDVPVEVVGSILKRGLNTFPRISAGNRTLIGEKMVGPNKDTDSECNFYELKALAEYVSKCGRTEHWDKVARGELQLTTAALLVDAELAMNFH